MDDAPRVSVVVPSFQNAHYIRATMESVLAQTFRDFELVVADHSPRDSTWEILQEFTRDPRVRLLRTPTGGGAERNWNAVTREARGDLASSCAVTTCWRPTRWPPRWRPSTSRTSGS